VATWQQIPQYPRQMVLAATTRPLEVPNGHYEAIKSAWRPPGGRWTFMVLIF
jgi:hypothetical protein